MNARGWQIVSVIGILALVAIVGMVVWRDMKLASQMPQYNGMPMPYMSAPASDPAAAPTVVMPAACPMSGRTMQGMAAPVTPMRGCGGCRMGGGRGMMMMPRTPAPMPPSTP